MVFKNRLSKNAALIAILVTITSFSTKKFTLDGGTIINSNIIMAVNTTPPEIKATNASGCAGTVTYQWQQSPDGKNFIDIPAATATSYQPTVVLTTTQFRRRGICSGDTAYTNNVATIIVQ